MLAIFYGPQLHCMGVRCIQIPNYKPTCTEPPVANLTMPLYRLHITLLRFHPVMKYI